MTERRGPPAGRRSLARRVTAAVRRRLAPHPVPLENPPLPYPSVALYHWRPLDGSLNFGDQLSQVIVSQVLAKAGFTLDDETDRYRRLLGIGSVVHFARDGDVVWGSGVNGKIRADEYHFKSLDVRAVRGPLSADYLRSRGITVPDVFGDPALLLPTLFGKRFVPKPARPYALVPNLHDLKMVENGRHLVSPLWGWNRCVEAILSAEFIVASSLHGLIIAEAYGIPARYLRLSETENLFKYQDYIEGTGRTELIPARSIDEALEMGGMPPIRFDPATLLKAFPLDLWQS